MRLWPLALVFFFLLAATSQAQLAPESGNLCPFEQLFPSAEKSQLFPSEINRETSGSNVRADISISSDWARYCSAKFLPFITAANIAKQGKNVTLEDLANYPSCPYQDIIPVKADDQLARISMFCLINADRARARRDFLIGGGSDGSKALLPNRQLQQAAESYAERMVREQFFSHFDPQGRSVVVRVRKSGYLKGTYLWLIGENLAWGYGRRGTPEGINLAFLNSPAHKKVLNDARFRSIGIGLAPGSPIAQGVTGSTWALIFAKRRFKSGR